VKLKDFVYVADWAAMSKAALDAVKSANAYLLTSAPNQLKIVKAARWRLPMHRMQPGRRRCRSLVQGRCHVPLALKHTKYIWLNSRIIRHQPLLSYQHIEK
jgi:hypothetical protein